MGVLIKNEFYKLKREWFMIFLLLLSLLPIITGGAGAILSKCITKSEIVCYEDLGAEAIRKLQVKDFPVIVVIDSEGNNLYETAIKKYCTLE